MEWTPSYRLASALRILRRRLETAPTYMMDRTGSQIDFSVVAGVIPGSTRNTVGAFASFSLWSRNLLNETHVYRRDPANRATLGDYGNLNAPRTFGAEISVNF